MNRSTRLATRLHAEAPEDAFHRKRKPQGDPRPILELMQALGIDLQTHFGDAAEAPWEGAHELAHWMCAHPSRRNDPHYGLGEPGGDGLLVRSQQEEEHASLLGILLEREHGMLWQDTFSDHGWQSRDAECISERLESLMRMGLIDAEGRPTFCRRSK